MTSDEIHSFIQRLVHRELEPGELSALTTRDLGDINGYLAEYASAESTGPCSGLSPDVYTRVPALGTQVTKCTYSEEEILSEFGVLE